jgi:quinol monooxygenase YgiN
MEKLTLVANIKAKSDKIEFVKEELVKLIDAAHAEEGCGLFIFIRTPKEVLIKSIDWTSTSCYSFLH